MSESVQTLHLWFNGHHVVTMGTGQKLRMSRYQHETFLRLVSTRDVQQEEG
jgi:two-component system LytT family response regulator